MRETSQISSVGSLCTLRLLFVPDTAAANLAWRRLCAPEWIKMPIPTVLRSRFWACVVVSVALSHQMVARGVHPEGADRTRVLRLAAEQCEGPGPTAPANTVKVGPWVSPPTRPVFGDLSVAQRAESTPGSRIWTPSA